MKHSKANGFYAKVVKRALDIFLSALALIVLSPILAVTALLVRLKLGSPVIYKAERPGKIDPKTGKERIFRLYKFRSMTNAKDENGKLLPDKERLTKFGRLLRSTSLDELPELMNILKGDMSIVGPRPLALSYLQYYTPEERHRHDVRPGLTGLAQASGRNGLSWEQKFALDLRYIANISLIEDIKIIFMTAIKVIRREGIGQGEKAPVSLSVERKKVQEETANV